MLSTPSLQMLSEETRGVLLKMIGDAGSNPALRKAIDTTTGLTGVSLEAPAKQLVPLMADFTRSIPRTVRDGATASQWKAITSLSMPKFSTTEAAASPAFTTTVAAKSAGYKVHGLRGQVTREAVAASAGFDPALAKETANCLLLAIKVQEMYQLGGNITALATPGAPTLSEQNGLGSLAAATYSVRIAALTLPAANRVTIQRPVDYDGTNAFLDGVAQANLDPSSDGVTVVGAETSLALAGGGDALKVTWAAVPGAAAYGVFVGIAAGAANLKLEAVVTQTSVTFKTLATTGQIGTGPAGTSADANTYDGIIAQLVAAGSGAYVKNLNAKLTGANGEIVEIQDAFAQMYDNAKLGGYRLLVGGQDKRLLTRLGYSQDSAQVVVSSNPSDKAGYVIGTSARTIVNAVSGIDCPIEVLPWIPGGMIIFLPTSIPYTEANAEAAFDMAMGYDWERWDYSSTTSTGPVYPFEVRSYGVLRGIFPGGCGVVYNIFKG